MYSYTHEKLWQAVDTLATGTGSIQDGLFSAAMAIHVLSVKDFPSEMGQEFASMWHELTKVPAIADEGTLQATISRMSEQEAADHASCIFSLYTRISDVD